MKFFEDVVKYHKIFLASMRIFLLQSIFQEGEKTEKWPFLASIT